MNYLEDDQFLHLYYTSPFNLLLSLITWQDKQELREKQGYSEENKEKRENKLGFRWYLKLEAYPSYSKLTQHLSSTFSLFFLLTQE